MNKRSPYEEPEFLIFEVLCDIVTASDETLPDVGDETEDNDWGMGIVPF